MGVDWYGRPDRQSLYGDVCLGEAWEGPPAHAHGGAIAALLDDAMGMLAWYAGNKVMTAKMNVSYRSPTPLYVPLHVVAWVEEKRGRKVSVRARIETPDGRITAESDGLFVEHPQMFNGEKAADFAQFQR